MRRHVTRIPPNALTKCKRYTVTVLRPLFRTALNGTWPPLESLRSIHMEIRRPRELPARRRFTWARVTSRVGFDGEDGTQIPFQLGLGPRPFDAVLS